MCCGSFSTARRRASGNGYIRLGAPRRQDFDAVLAAINELGPGKADA
jgi:hypothetical protein